MSIRLIALDLDGTVLEDDHATISSRTKKAIRSALQRGIFVVPATGRLNSLLPVSVMGIEGIRYTITSNGAVISDLKDNRIVGSNFISGDLARKVLAFLPTDEIPVEIFRKGKLFVENRYLDYFSNYPIPFLHLEFLKHVHADVERLEDFVRIHHDCIEKINIPYVPERMKKSLWMRVSALDSLSVTSSVPDNMEINDAEANKGHALRELCSYLQIPREDVMAVGDNGNDISMLEFAGLSVAMENGTEAAKASASAVTGSNMEDGAALAMERYALA